MNIDTLVATMKQTDFEKYKLMNINTDAIFANQSDENSCSEIKVGEKRAQMITTTTTGVGCNRNFALNYSTADICLIADDDLRYIDGYEKKIIDAFNANPKADMIIFNIKTKGMDVGRRENTRAKRIRIYNFLNYGAVRITFKRDTVTKANIWFTHLFGGGAKYSSGEDTMFLRDALKKGLKLYTCSDYICEVDQMDSTWFKGYNEKFFFDKGALFKAIFPLIYLVFTCFYFPMKFKGKSDLGYIKLARLMNHGSQSFKKGLSYEQYKNNHNS